MQVLGLTILSCLESFEFLSSSSILLETFALCITKHAYPGSIAVQLKLYRRSLCFICSHFAAHQNNVSQRNNNCMTTLKNLKFKSDRLSEVIVPKAVDDETCNYNSIDVCQDEKLTEDGDVSIVADAALDIDTPPPSGGNADKIKQQSLLLLKNDLVVWAGDFNYRVDVDYDFAVQKAALYNLLLDSSFGNMNLGRRNSSSTYEEQLEELLKHDQLSNEMKSGNIFPGFSEAKITFPPTYKYDKGKPGTRQSEVTTYR